MVLVIVRSGRTSSSSIHLSRLSRRSGPPPFHHTLHFPRMCAMSFSEKPRLRADAKMSCAPYSATFDRRSWHVYPPGNSAAAASLICRTGEAQQSAAAKIVVLNMTSPYFFGRNKHPWRLLVGKGHCARKRL